MPSLATNRQPGQVVSASDINGLATALNTILSGSEFSDAASARIGAMVAAAGGSYNSSTKQITLPGAAINDGTPSGSTTYSGSKIEALVNALLSSNLFNEAVQDQIGAMVAAAGGTYNDAAGTITFPAGGGGSIDDSTNLSSASPSTTAAWSASNTKTQILGLVNDASNSATNRVWSAAKSKAYADSVATSGGSAVSLGKIDASSAPYSMSTTGTAAANGAALQQAISDAAGREVTAKAGDYPMVGVSIADDHVNLNMPGVYFLHPQGSTPAMVVERTPGTPMSVGATYLTWWGPWQPSGVTVSSLLQAIPATGLNRFKGGRVYRIDSRDAYPWSWSALNLYNVGDTPDYSQTDGLMWQAETFPLLGIGMTVSNVSGNSGPLESMMVQGQTSGSSGLVQSSLVGNGSGGITASQRHITFTSVTGDFVDGENLVRIAGGNPTYPTGSIAAVGAVVGTVTGLPVLLTSDIFPLQYGRTTAAQAVAGTVTPTRTDNTVQLREVDTKPICRIRGLGLDVQGAREDPDTYIGSSSRNDVIQLRGVYMPDVEWRVRNAWTRAMCVWSDYMGTFTGLVDQMPNHAILTQQAFAYGLELKAGSKGTLIKLRGHTVRHLFTTNPNQRTYSQANNYASGKWSQWDYGTPIRTTVDGFVVEAAFAPGMDTHPGDYYTTFMNGRIHGGGSGGRYNTDNNSAYSTRGFGTKWKNVECDDSAVGFLIGGVEHDAGINHRYVLENVHVSGALAQCVVTPTAMVAGQATVVVSAGEFSHRVNYPKDAAGTVEATNTKYGLQVSVQVGDGVNLETKSDALFRKFGAAAIRALGSGTVTIYSAIADFTENPSSGLAGMIRAEGTRTIKVFEAKYNGNPTYLLRNQSGNSTWLLGDLQWLGTGTAPQLMLTSAGTPTVTQVAPATNAGGSGSSGTQVSVDGANVSTLDISSFPAVKVLTTGADITGPTASANVADLSAFQTTLPTGTYLLEADLMYSVTSGTAGALRFGFGGAGSAGGSMSNGISTQWTSRTAAVNVILNALATAGTAQAVTEPTANIAGSSPGTFATILNWQLRANLVVTTAGVFGLIWQTSSGADRVGTLKPGSFLKVTKVS